MKPLMRRRDDIYEHLPMTEQTRDELKRGTPPFWSVEERCRLLRELIVHEDKLTTERIQALYTLQGFLFASFGLLSRTESQLSLSVRVMITIVAVVGMTSARVYWQELHFNTAAITQLLRDWKDLEDLFKELTYPPIIGFLAKNEQRAGGPMWLPRRTVPVLFIGVWIVVAVVAWL